MKFRIRDKEIGDENETYFIADIGANHDGDLQRAKDLIRLASDAGADAAKFQHFQAKTIVSKQGFNELRVGATHQSNWKKGVYETYEDASIDLAWNNELNEECEKCGIHFFSSIYDLDILTEMADLVPAFKIGSGDIDWTEMLEATSKFGKPVIIAAGASKLHEVENAINTIQLRNSDVALLQCNTNYTGSSNNFKYLNLNVLKSFKERFGDVVLGLSDHTPGHTSVLGAVALGAKIIEKHFTDDKNRVGPDHGFALDSYDWKNMISEVKNLEDALGDGIKTIENNEIDSFLVQRRSLRSKQLIKAGDHITSQNLVALRPRTQNGISPSELKNIIGKRVKNTLKEGLEIEWSNLEY